MNFSGIGGITIVVVAVLWLFVFIPSWFNASSERTQERKVAREVKRAVVAAKQPILKAPKTKVSSLSEQIYRSEKIVGALKFFTWAFLLIAAGLGLATIRVEFLSGWAIASAVLAAVCLRSLVMALAAQRRLLEGSIRSRGAVATTAAATLARVQADQAAQVRLAQQAHRAAAAERAAWLEAREAAASAKQFKAEPLPAPSYASQVGSLEVPVFAPVVELGDVAAAAQASPATTGAQALSPETINEILRRRRASGE